jgi:phosphoribosyl 1,2-cyclic phosphodiesterase
MEGEMIKLIVLGSGSAGNSIYVDLDGVKILIDCGFTKKEMNKRLATIGRSMDDIERVFITHDHGDHLHNWVKKEREKGVFKPALYLPNQSEDVDYIDEFWIQSFPLMHDSGSGSVGYVIKDKSGNKIAIIMDSGCIPEEIVPNLFDCAAILIETNYSIEMLIESPYPTELQERIASNVGHLRDQCAAEVVGMVAWPGLKYVVALHLSRTCINETLARFELENAVVDCGYEVVVSEQGKPTKLMVVM